MPILVDNVLDRFCLSQCCLRMTKYVWHANLFDGNIDNPGGGTTRRFPRLPKGERTLGRWFNTAAFAITPPGRFGSSGRNILISPGFNQWDLSLLKNFNLREGVRLQFRAEAFNIWNHPSFTGINTNLSAQNFGQISNSGPGRVLEFGLRLAF